jgi:2-oxoisovalerate dehydrogenase E2 component (dihydrolipoyl transacylase)
MLRLLVAKRLPALHRPALFAAQRCCMSSKPFLLSDIGEGIAEVEVMQWFVKAGDKVEQFDKLCEVQSDKATVEITSPFVGSIASLAYAAGEIAKTGTPLLHYVPEGEANAVAASVPPAAKTVPAPAPPAAKAVAAPAGSLPTNPFLLSDIGEGIAEVEVMQWFVKAGDKVEQFDKLCEVQSDKATVEITSPFVGSIASLAYAAGEIAKTGTPLLHYVPDGAAKAPAAVAAVAAPAAAAPASATAAARPAAAATAGGKTKVLAAPAARGIAKQHGVDLAMVTGTGRNGHVTKEDVLIYVARGAALPPRVVAAATSATPAPPAATQPAAIPATAPAARSAAKSASPPLEPPPRAMSGVVADRVEPIRGIRKAMFKQMTAALAVPTFSYCDEVQMDALMTARLELKELAAKYGVSKFTLMPMLIKATSLALAEFPLLNSSISADGTELVFKGSHNIGLAMDTPTGLLVPNVKNVQSKSLLEIASELERLQTDASTGKLGMTDLKDGTFSISNIGNLGGTYTGPVINLPEVAIVGLGKTRPSPRYDEKGNLVKVSIMQVSWTADHRVIDGATMARFSNAWIGYLEKPTTMLLHL